VLKVNDVPVLLEVGDFLKHCMEHGECDALGLKRLHGLELGGGAAARHEAFGVVNGEVHNVLQLSVLQNAVPRAEDLGALSRVVVDDSNVRGRKVVVE